MAGEGSIDADIEEGHGAGVGDGFPISSNLAEGEDYPLEEMVALAVEVLVAENTGQGRARYPHLAGQVSSCCEDLVVDAAAVLFGATDDPATIIVDWHALDRRDATVVRASTTSSWVWVDGDWMGEFELPDGAGQ